MQHALASKFLGPIFTAAALILFSFTPSASAKDAAKDAGKGIAKPTGRIAVKSGDKIAFLGDSITAAGWENPAGYVRLVMAGLAANGIIAEAVPTGVNGHKSDQMLARLETDVLGKKPQRPGPVNTTRRSHNAALSRRTSPRSSSRPPPRA